MPSQPRTKQGVKATMEPAATEAQPLAEERAAIPASSLAGRGWRRRQITFWTPPIPPATGIGLGTGTGWFGYSLATANVQPGSVWPSVVVIGLGMAYDLGRRVIDRRG